MKKNKNNNEWVEILINIKGFTFKISVNNDDVRKITTKSQAQEWVLKYIYNNLINHKDKNGYKY